MNITKAVRLYLEEHGTLRRCLSLGVVSYSKLSRHLVAELGLAQGDFDAVLAACRRYRPPAAVSERRILQLIEKSTVTVRTCVAVFVVDRHTPLKALFGLHSVLAEHRAPLQAIEGESGITLITQDEHIGKLRRALKHYISKETSGLVALVIKSPPELERVPGFVAHLYTLLAERGINIVEEMSCWTDTIIIIEKKDLGRAMGLLGYPSSSSSASSFSPSSSASS